MSCYFFTVVWANIMPGFIVFILHRSICSGSRCLNDMYYNTGLPGFVSGKWVLKNAHSPVVCPKWYFRVDRLFEDVIFMLTKYFSRRLSIPFGLVTGECPRKMHL